jgi:type IV pilus assembly protein PilM
MMNLLSNMNFGNIYKKGLGSLNPSRGKGTWGLEIGDKELKAAKVRFRNGKLLVEAIDRVEYSTVNQGMTLGNPELIEKAVTVFKGRNLVNESDKIIASISGGMALLRFVSLPPMRKSHLAQAIKYELRKQIPFELQEIIWDSHNFSGGTKSYKRTEIGIFATKKENIYRLLPSLEPIKMNLEAIQTIPVAIYNLIQMSSDWEEDVIVLNVGNENADFIVVGKSTFWNRSISVSEINMDFVREIQRSMGYYHSRTKESKAENMFLIGEAFKDAEKIKFIDENFEGKVTHLDLLDNIQSIVNKKTIYGFEAALGLAVHGLGLGRININLLPYDYIRKRQVPKQRALAGVITILIFLGLLTQGLKDYTGWAKLSKYADPVNSTLNEVKRVETVYKNTGKKVEEGEEKLHALKSIGSGGAYYMEAIRKIIDMMPEKVYLLSMESRGVFSSDNKEKTKSSKNLPRGEKTSTPKNADGAKREVIISIKGESYDPRISYIEEMVKKPLEDLMLSGQQVPSFRNVEIVKGSVHHVDLLEKKDEPDDLNVDQNIRPISFEIRWVVNKIN